jgi:hypothetical protein
VASALIGWMQKRYSIGLVPGEVERDRVLAFRFDLWGHNKSETRIHV